MIRIGFSPDDRTSGIVRLYEVLSSALADDRANLDLDCRDAKYLGPFATAILHATFLLAIRRGTRPRILLPEAPPALAAYCAFSGLRHVFLGEPLPDPNHPDCETMPTASFEVASWNIPDPLVRLLRRHRPRLPSETEDLLRMALNEAIQNIQDHSSSPIGGVFSARFISSQNVVVAGIVDFGAGILATLRRRYPDIPSSGDAVRRVLEGHHSSRSVPNNAGLGISNLASIARSLGGAMTIVTGDTAAEVVSSAKSPRIRALRYPVRGTGVFLRFAAGAPGDDDGG